MITSIPLWSEPVSSAEFSSTFLDFLQSSHLLLELLWQQQPPPSTRPKNPRSCYAKDNARVQVGDLENIGLLNDKKKSIALFGGRTISFCKACLEFSNVTFRNFYL
jgi:hypothetical protein